MNNNRVMILAVCVLCLAVGIVIGVVGTGSRKETAPGEMATSSEATEAQSSTAVLETRTALQTEPGTEKPTVNDTVSTTQPPKQTQTQKDDVTKGENDSSSQSEPETEPDREPTPEPEPDESGDGEDLEWSPDIM